MRMNIFGFQMAVKNFLKRNTINFLNYALILRRSVFTIFYSIFYRFVNKTRNLLFIIQLVIYIIYGDSTIIGFVGFVANLLNRPTDGATVSVRKRVTFRPLVSTSVK
jgi:hypothetical protein